MDIMTLAKIKNETERLREELEVARKALAEKIDLEISIFVNSADRYVEYRVEYRMREYEKMQFRSSSALVQAIINEVAHAIREDFSNDGE